MVFPGFSFLELGNYVNSFISATIKRWLIVKRLEISCYMLSACDSKLIARGHWCSCYLGHSNLICCCSGGLDGGIG